MKVKLNLYPSDLIPARRLRVRYEKWRDIYYHEERVTWFDDLVIASLDWFDYRLRSINDWWKNFREQRYVRVDYPDIWNLEHTLAIIIAPALRKLKEEKHGAPCVDDADVPEHLRCGITRDEQFGPETDENFFKRWEYILDEMIWAFNEYARDMDSDDYEGSGQFYHNRGQLAMITKPLEDNSGLHSVSFNHQKDPSKPKYWVDYDGLEKYNARKRNGVRLFAKYYENLWD